MWNFNFVSEGWVGTVAAHVEASVWRPSEMPCEVGLRFPLARVWEWGRAFTSWFPPPLGQDVANLSLQEPFTSDEDVTVVLKKALALEPGSCQLKIFCGSWTQIQGLWVRTSVLFASTQFWVPSSCTLFYILHEVQLTHVASQSRVSDPSWVKCFDETLVFLICWSHPLFCFESSANSRFT